MVSRHLDHKLRFSIFTQRISWNERCAHCSPASRFSISSSARFVFRSTGRSSATERNGVEENAAAPPETFTSGYKQAATHALIVQSTSHNLQIILHMLTRLMSTKSREKHDAMAGQLMRRWSSTRRSFTPRSTAQCISASHWSSPQLYPGGRSALACSHVSSTGKGAPAQTANQINPLGPRSAGPVATATEFQSMQKVADVHRIGQKSSGVDTYTPGLRGGL